MTDLLKDRIETSWISKEDTKRQKNDIHFKDMKEENDKTKDRTLQNNILLSPGQWTDEKNKQEDQEILIKIYLSSSKWLTGITFNTEICLQYKKKWTKNLYSVSNSLWRDISNHSKKKNERDPSSGKTIERYRKRNTKPFYIRISKGWLDLSSQKKKTQESIISILGS